MKLALTSFIVATTVFHIVVEAENPSTLHYYGENYGPQETRSPKETRAPKESRSPKETRAPKGSKKAKGRLSSGTAYKVQKKGTTKTSKEGKGGKGGKGSDQSCGRGQCPLSEEETPRFRDLSVNVNLSGIGTVLEISNIRNFESAARRTIEDAFDFFCPNLLRRVLLVQLEGQAQDDEENPGYRKLRQRGDTRVILELNPSPPSVDSAKLVTRALSDQGSARRRMLGTEILSVDGRDTKRKLYEWKEKKQSKGSKKSKGSKSSSGGKGGKGKTPTQTKCQFNTLIGNLQDTRDPFFNEVEEIEAVVTEERAFDFPFKHDKKV